MLQTLAVFGYRSLHDLVMPLAPLTVISGENGSGKSNLYKALGLLTDCAAGRVINSLAHEGGLPHVLWAGPERVSAAMLSGEQAVQGGPRRQVVRLKLGFSSDDYGYLLELGMPVPGALGGSLFSLDPEIKREAVWHGPHWRQAGVLFDRKGSVVRRREGRKWVVVEQHLPVHHSLFHCAGEPSVAPELYALQRAMQGWRFYADFRTDSDAPARQLWPATRTPVLSRDGRDLAAALQTIIEVGDERALHSAVDDAFPGSRLVIDAPREGYLSVALEQPGMLRPLGVQEWSDGTLRYILLVAALLSPRPPALLVLNEPENSLHADLLPALSRLISAAADLGQVWVISHSNRLGNALDNNHGAMQHVLQKSLGRTEIAGLRELDKPRWQWP